MPVVYVDSRSTSKLCPIHSAQITYTNDSRIGECSKGGELWHRDVVATWNLISRALRGDGGVAPSPVGFNLDGSPVPWGSIATHDPTALPRGLWARWKSLPQTQEAIVLNRMKRQGQTALR